jgi:hypothetical protein
MTEQITRRHVIGADADLDFLFEQVDGLRELASHPELAQERARVYDFSIRWGTLLHGRLERLAYYYGRGELAPEEQARYESLRRELQRALPMIERLGLARPDAALNSR